MMSGKLFYLEDRRSPHYIFELEWQEICLLPLEPGPFLVIAKGTVRGIGADKINVGIYLRLEVHGMVSGLVGFDETEFNNEPLRLPDINSFVLLVAANVPYEGGAGSGQLPPPHRAVLMARIGTRAPDTAGALSNIKIAAYPVDEIVATMVEEPGPWQLG